MSYGVLDFNHEYFKVYCEFAVENVILLICRSTS